MKYRKRNEQVIGEEVEAMQLNDTNAEEVASFTGGHVITEQHPEQGMITFVLVPRAGIGPLFIMNQRWVVNHGDGWWEVLHPEAFEEEFVEAG